MDELYQAMVEQGIAHAKRQAGDPTWRDELLQECREVAGFLLSDPSIVEGTLLGKLIAMLGLVERLWEEREEALRAAERSPTPGSVTEMPKLLPMAGVWLVEYQPGLNATCLGKHPEPMRLAAAGMHLQPLIEVLSEAKATGHSSTQLLAEAVVEYLAGLPQEGTDDERGATGHGPGPD